MGDTLVSRLKEKRRTLVKDACSSRDLEFNDQVIPVEQVHKAYMSALGFTYATITTTDSYLSG